MIMLRFKSKEDRDDLLHKTKKMKKYVDEIIDCIEDCEYEDEEYNERRYRHDDEWKDEENHGRYGYMRRK